MPVIELRNVGQAEGGITSGEIGSILAAVLVQSIFGKLAGMGLSAAQDWLQQKGISFALPSDVLGEISATVAEVQGNTRCFLGTVGQALETLERVLPTQTTSTLSEALAVAQARQTELSTTAEQLQGEMAQGVALVAEKVSILEGQVAELGKTAQEQVGKAQELMAENVTFAVDEVVKLQGQLKSVTDEATRVKEQVARRAEGLSQLLNGLAGTAEANTSANSNLTGVTPTEAAAVQRELAELGTFVMQRAAAAQTSAAENVAFAKEEVARVQGQLQSAAETGKRMQAELSQKAQEMTLAFGALAKLPKTFRK